MLCVYGVIYKITNVVNGKVYIGQTTRDFNNRYCAKGKGIERVYNYHKRLKKVDIKGFNRHLCDSISKYGFDKFDITFPYDVAFSKKELDIKEKTYISLFKSMDIRFGYNRQEGGFGGKNCEEVTIKAVNTMIKNNVTRAVNQLEIPSMKILNTYPAISFATKSLNLTRSAIKNVLNPKYESSLTAGGYGWEYVDEKNKKYDDVDFLKSEKVNKMIIDLYTKGYSYNKISKCLNINRNRITSVLTKNNLKTSKDIKKEVAIRKRKEVIYYFNKGFTQGEIIKITGYTRSIVQKALTKYKNKEIDENGFKILT